MCVCAFVRLSVCYNNIGTEGLLSLAAAMRVTSTLSHVYIWGNHLEEPVCQVSGRTPPRRSRLVTRPLTPPLPSRLSET